MVAGVLTTATLAVGALGCGLWASSEHERYSDEGVALAEREDARSRGKTIALVADGLWVGAAAAAALTAYWYHESKDETARDDRTVRVTPAGAGLVVQGAF